jgi:hypothetical protein
MRKRIAENILVENEVKTDFILDNQGNPTDETYNYKEYKVLDDEDYVLEVGRYTEDTITVEQICERTGIAFGVSAWFFE